MPPVDPSFATARTEVGSRMRISGLRWIMIGLVFLATAINYVDRQTLNLLAPVITRELGIGKAAFGQIASLFLLAYTASMAISGRLYDRIGTKTGFAFSIAIWSLACAGHAWVGGMVGLAVWRVALGVGEAGNWPGAAKCVSEWFPVRERALAMAIFNSGAALGAVVAPPVVIAVAESHGWRHTFVLTGFLGLVWLIAWLLIYRSPGRHPWMTNEEHAHIAGGLPAEAERGARPYRELLRRREVWGLMAGRFFTDPVWWLYLVWLPQYLYDERGLDMKAIGLSAWAPYLAAAAGAIAGGGTSGRLIARGWSVDRARKLVIVSGAVGMPVGLAAAGATTVEGALAACGVALFAFQAFINNVQTLPSDLFASRDVGAVAGLGGAAAGLGSALAIAATGLLIERVGYHAVFVLAAVLPVVGTASLVALVGTVRRVDWEGSPT